MDLTLQLPAFLCSHKAWGLKIATVTPVEGGGAVLCGDGSLALIMESEFVKAHNPKPGEYLLIFDDGFKKVVSAEAFQDKRSGYKPIVSEVVKS